MRPEACLALDIGATNIKFGIVRSKAGAPPDEIESFQMLPTDRNLGPEGLVNQVVEIYHRLGAPLNSKRKIPVGICAAGPLDPVDGRLLVPVNLTDGGAAWSNFPLAKKISEKLAVEVSLENDAAAAALGELWKGKGRGHQDFLVMTLGTGLGVAVVRDGAIVRATGGLHTELGHSLIDFNDDFTALPSRVQGSLESYLGPKYFLFRFSEARGIKTSGEDYMSLILSNDPLALKWAESFKTVLLGGMFNFFLAFAPDLYIFQGGFSPLIDFLKPDLEKEFGAKILGFGRPDRSSPQVQTSEISRTCGVYGAAYRLFHS